MHKINKDKKEKNPHPKKKRQNRVPQDPHQVHINAKTELAIGERKKHRSAAST